jgi:UDP-2-acetamido-2-deoxy-ribo-hexuluronate aminotransferase
MNFVDLAGQQRRIAEKLHANIAGVLTHGQYINGPEVRELEKTLAAYVGAKHAVGCASGTDALLMALMALDIGPGDAVFTTPFTFFATAEVISLVGATPVFVDIDPATFNIDPARLEWAVEALERNDPAIHPLPHASGGKLTPRAVIPVDLFGLPADYDEIEAVAARRDLAVIEDAAQSFGGQYKGRKACSFGRIACTSFFPAKPLGCYGDGGMCFTDDDRIAALLESIRVHGQGIDKYENIRIGINGRLDTLQAAILLAKFAIFPEEIDLRQEVVHRYNQLLAGLVKTPDVPAGYLSAWAQYSILVRDGVERAALLAKLKEARIPTAIYYPKPLHCQGAFAGLGYKEGDFPVSEDCARRIFSLPMHPYLTAEDQSRIVSLFR